jgi:hypothetical protein
VEFTTRAQVDRAIREGLVLGACHHDCELYDRGCKLKQCYKCQKYGHIGTQCIANDTCGYCAEPHDTRQCKNREEPNFTPKCTLCKGPHTAWSNGYQVRKTQIAKVENARRNRPMYYGSSETVAQPSRRPAITDAGPASVEPRTGPIQSQTTLIPSRQRKRTVQTTSSDHRDSQATMPPKKVQGAATQATQSQPGFCVFTPEDGQNKNSDLMLALENREKEIRMHREDSIWTGRIRHTTLQALRQQNNSRNKHQSI